ncbi:uncharacterized protein BDW43DRAFT_279104 [Aspergillus alliaceus]|uniref:uncharacterized protein n=1 Tax=Petromyces alliaceus TaxID=209559 RepID=UPI0012A5BB6D|nr:uncharacterized protein BDW43DRAFT_279104 [Aspergillus alliaceus]KAB8232639.1 hypothetical protein BDW43DRAFT_279104 [Aspergillus alliaceus]
MDTSGRARRKRVMVCKKRSSQRAKRMPEPEVDERHNLSTWQGGVPKRGLSRWISDTRLIKFFILLNGQKID